MPLLVTRPWLVLTSIYSRRIMEHARKAQRSLQISWLKRPGMHLLPNLP